ncbi:nucleoside 2-deoxyribosyltransferase [Kocuria sabuli]|uniref:nucleoside 2-deoxyribosyltransferase n=1 Tax=Kocuria sabuli TaxID=3071448 RepID=UPI0034D4D65A
MPFDPAFDDVYHVAIKAAVEKAGCIPARVDQLMHGQDAVTETYRQIQRCQAVIADLSTAEPDVLYEVGYAHALGKPVVQLCSTDPASLPFMVRNRDTIFYRPGQTYLLIDVLAEYVAHLLDIPS